MPIVAAPLRRPPFLLSAEVCLDFSCLVSCLYILDNIEGFGSVSAILAFFLNFMKAFTIYNAHPGLSLLGQSQALPCGLWARMPEIVSPLTH